MSTLLSLDNVTTYYGQMRILEGISLQVGNGELVCLLGGNASGKSTTLKTILGIVRPRSGRVLLDDQDVTSWPVPQRIARGIAIVPENRRLFGQMTVKENLELGAVLRRTENLDEDFDRIHALFPRLLERRQQLACTLSGGEQQEPGPGRERTGDLQPTPVRIRQRVRGLIPAVAREALTEERQHLLGQRPHAAFFAHGPGQPEYRFHGRRPGVAIRRGHDVLDH